MGTMDETFTHMRELGKELKEQGKKHKRILNDIRRLYRVIDSLEAEKEDVEYTILQLERGMEDFDWAIKGVMDARSHQGEARG